MTEPTPRRRVHRTKDHSKTHGGKYVWGPKRTFVAVECRAGDYRTPPGLSMTRAEKDFRQHRRDMGVLGVAPEYERVQIDLPPGTRKRLEATAAARGQTLRAYLMQFLLATHPEEEEGG